jgi:uncharacterized protein (DUF433 family)
MEVPKYVGVGLYTVPEAARLLGVSAGKLRRWAQGYKLAGHRRSEPVLRREYPELAELGVLTFLDLIELYLVVRFRQQGVSMQTIKRNAQVAAERFHTNHPFAVKRFHASGKDLIAETERREPGRAAQRVYEDLLKSQLVLDQVAESFFKNLEYEGELAREYWPLGRNRPVVLDPARSFGQPMDPETGVTTRTLCDMHQAGESVEEVARWFHVKPEAVLAAVEYEQSLTRAA